MAFLGMGRRTGRSKKIFGFSISTLVVAGLVIWQWKWIKANVIDKIIKPGVPKV